MTETLGFALPFPVSCAKRNAFFPLERLYICQDEQYLLPKRIAQGLSHRLEAPALHYWEMSLT
jgi:hypothetical protein